MPFLLDTLLKHVINACTYILNRTSPTGLERSSSVDIVSGMAMSNENGSKMIELVGAAFVNRLRGSGLTCSLDKLDSGLLKAPGL